MTTDMPYEAPTIRDLGDLTQITADVHHVTMGVAGTAGLSAPMTPGGGGGGGGGGFTADAGPTPDVATPDVSDTSPGEDTGGGFGDVSPGDAQGGGTDSGSPGVVSGDTTGGRLPFTGFPAAAIAVFGGMMSATGVAIRRALKREPPSL